MPMWKVLKDERISRGLCVDCASGPPKKGCFRCSKCLIEDQRNRKLKRLYREEDGECVNCGRKLTQKDLDRERLECAACASRSTEESRRWQIKKKEEKLCMGCGKPARPKGSYCARCCKIRNRQCVLRHRRLRLAGLCRCGAISIAGRSWCPRCSANRRIKYLKEKMKLQAKKEATYQASNGLVDPYNRLTIGGTDANAPATASK